MKNDAIFEEVSATESQISEKFGTRINIVPKLITINKNPKIKVNANATNDKIPAELKISPKIAIFEKIFPSLTRKFLNSVFAFNSLYDCGICPPYNLIH